MQCEIKAFGRGTAATVCKRVGKLTLKAATVDESETITLLGQIVMRPKLFQILTWLGKSLVDGKLTDSEKRQLADMTGRCEKERERASGVESIT